jgi:hypothetical protein
MLKENRIHLVPSTESGEANHSEPRFVELVRPARRNQGLDARDIVRETLAIARECRKVVASSNAKNQLLVDLVASLAVARLKKRGTR